jgi:hypothetical protein
MASLLYGKFQLFHRNFSLMEKLQNETAMYTRLVYIDTVGHAKDTNFQHLVNISLMTSAFWCKSSRTIFFFNSDTTDS